MKLFMDRYRQRNRRTAAINGDLLIVGGALALMIGIEKRQAIEGLALGSFLFACGGALFWWSRREAAFPSDQFSLRTLPRR